MTPLDAANVALSPGVRVIEANAGTGKTFALTTLFLRLVVEERIEVQRIVAMTFTEAATKELRDRIRQRLRLTLEAIREGNLSVPLVEKWKTAPGWTEAATELEAALLDFDQARISTIHGFSQRMLREWALETGAPFDAEVLPDPALLIEEILNDFWRERFCTPDFLPALLLGKGKRQTFAKLVMQRVSHPGLQLRPLPKKSCTELESEIHASLKQVVELPEWEDVCASLQSHTKAAIKNLLPSAQSAVAQLRKGEVPSCGCFDSLLSLTQEAVLNNKLLKSPEYHHPILGVISEMAEAASEWNHALRHAVLEFVIPRFQEQKEIRNLLTYDDLLQRLRGALEGPGANILRSIAENRFGAALVDEFQDTDMVQYGILKPLFSGPEHRLLFIGDPKQAIYGFRGADVGTYLEVRDSVEERYSLLENYRSEPKLIDAVNRFFGAQDAFESTQISYEASTAPARSKAGFQSITDGNAPLRIRYLETKPLPVTEAFPEVRKQVAADVATLLASGAKIGERDLSARDIAILVRSGFDGAEIQRELAVAGLRSVLLTDADVFESTEAADLQTILGAVLAPGQRGRFQAALATPLIGLDVAEIVAIDQTESVWQQWVDRFSKLRTLWEENGVLTMVRHLLFDQKAHGRLASMVGGERTLTNYLHLAELLQEEENSARHTPEALLDWLSRYRLAERENAEARQLRLESDEDTVRIATIHSSKGLEFPVVLIPTLWKPMIRSREKGENGLLYRDGSTGGEMIIDYQAGAEKDPSFTRYMRSESLRLAYVALTRAANRCMVYAGNFKDLGASALAHLIGASGENVEAKLRELAEASGGSIAFESIEPDAPKRSVDLPTPKLLELCDARPFGGSILDHGMVASFTSLKGQHPESRDRDAQSSGPMADREAYAGSIHGMERSMRCGYFFHELLETLDFQQPALVEPRVDELLLKHGFAGTPARDAVVKVVQDLLELPLEDGVTLSAVPMNQRMAEEDFWLPARSLRSSDLAHAITEGRTGEDTLPDDFAHRLEQVYFRPVDGFVQGVMDAVIRVNDRFYLIDWKSNWLGESLADYTPERLAAEMSDEFYHLQYLLYTVALDRFLRRRLPDYSYETHFGGVFYIFVRGVTPGNPESAIFRARPSRQLIDSLGKVLMP